MAKRKVIHRHHLSYPDGKHRGKVVRITAGEHLALHRMSRCPSKGFLIALVQYVAEHMFGDDVIEIDKGESVDKQGKD